MDTGDNAPHADLVGSTNTDSRPKLPGHDRVPALQELLGHASIATTQRYARLMDDAIQAEAARVLGGTMGNGMGNGS